MRILITPLNWGLGHATRSAVLANRFLADGHEVIWAADGAAFSWIQQHRPHETLIRLEDNRIHYGNHATRSILKSSLTIQARIKQEHLDLQKICDQLNPNLILSDNRYGCHHPSIKSVILTHQLKPRSGFPLLQPLVNAYFNRLLKPFNEVWVPDFEGDQSLCGELSSRNKHPNIQYIGPISRFKNLALPRKEFTLLMATGPESSRRTFAYELTNIARNHPTKMFILIGEELQVPDNTQNIPDPSQNELEILLNTCKKLISRPGYSTLMDWQICGNGAQSEWIPTPGQTEQHWLATLLHKSASHEAISK